MKNPGQISVEINTFSNPRFYPRSIRGVKSDTLLDALQLPLMISRTRCQTRPRRLKFPVSTHPARRAHFW